MEIKYLKNLIGFTDNTKAGVYKNLSGISETEIITIENKLNIKFPTAYKEFLFLSGNAGSSFNFGNAIEDDLENAVDWFQEFAQDNIQEFGESLGRPFWVFTSLHSCEQFEFFYLDDGDNPPVYAWSMYDAIDKEKHENLPLGVRLFKKSFSEMVDYFIERHRKGEI